MMNAIEIAGVKKSYGDTFSLHDVSLNVEHGKIFALLGLNGAGKTTLVKLILNLLNPDQGSIKINGIDSNNNLSRMGVGFIPEKFSFFHYYTVYGALSFFGKMKGIAAADLHNQIESSLKEFSIEELKNKQLKTLSKGQLQRVGLCHLLIGDNQLLILDEPFSGLDPLGMRELKEFFKKQKNLGKTIFLNSHILSEMELICDEVAIIHKGEIIVKKPVVEILHDFKNLEDFFAEKVTGVVGGKL
jgi:ABC-2 type transport system ATP-binding protein